MSINFLAFLLLLLSDQASSFFEAIPNSITPSVTRELVLTCQPPPRITTLFAIDIKKRHTALGIPRQNNVPPGRTAGEINQGQAYGQPYGQAYGQPYGQNNRDPGYNSYGDRAGYAYASGRKKRSTEDAFERVTLAKGKSLDIVPTIDRFKAEGTLTLPARLSLNISKPVDSDIGIYECQFTYTNVVGFVIVDSEITEVHGAVEQAIDQLQGEVGKLEDEIPTYQTIMNVVKKMADEAKESIKLTKYDVDALKKGQAEIVDTLAQLNEKVERLDATVAILREQFGGNEQITSSNSVSPGNSGQSNDQVSQNLLEMATRMDRLENTRIQAMSEQLDLIKSMHIETQTALEKIELTVNVTVEERLRKLEDQDVIGMSETVDSIVTIKIPKLEKDVADCQKNIENLSADAGKSNDAHDGEQKSSD